MFIVSLIQFQIYDNINYMVRDNWLNQHSSGGKEISLEGLVSGEEQQWAALHCH